MKNLTLILIFASLVWSCQSPNTVKTVEKTFKSQTQLTVDSILLPEIVQNHRWYCRGNKMAVLDMKSDNFLGHLFKLPDMNLSTKFAPKGKGPGEYISPGLIIMNNELQIGLYELSKNSIDFYNIVNDTICFEKTYKFPVWMAERNLPKSYSRVWQISDSILLGITFPPQIAEIDLIDIKNVNLIGSVDFPLKPTGNAGSYPYLFQADYFDGKLVLAYNYINRIEVYNVSNSEIKLNYIIGEDKTQEEIVLADKYDDMLLYYSAIACDKEKIYALYQGVPEGGLYNNGTNYSTLEIFDIKSGEGGDMINLSQYFDDIIVNRTTGDIYASNPICQEPYVYIVKPNKR